MATPEPNLALYLTEMKVLDWAGMVHWYVTHLGLRIAREDPQHQYALLESTGGRIALTGGRAPGISAGAFRLVFEAADIAGVHSRLVAHGLDVSHPDASHEGYRAIRFSDPEGTPITVFCWT
jgi:catechol 2,3-dioxygenase-like lactoylglutathione lyase family enzyme